MHTSHPLPSSDSGAGYKIVKLATGVHSVHSLVFRETFHPVIGPVAEAEALYVRQLRLCERVQQTEKPFVVWDVGLGSAANVLTVLRATRSIECSLNIHSFDNTLDPLSFALQHTSELTYLQGYEEIITKLLYEGRILFQQGKQDVEWQLHLGDFPAFVSQTTAEHLPKPHGIMFDAFSPATNPAMWTQQVFTNIYRLLDPGRPCALPTYSRSTVLRVTLLLAGFFVGVGHATGEKEETTIAANCIDLIEQPLDRRWLLRACRSHSAEPLREPVYRQARLSSETREKLEQHPQFR
jgi:tRNA U34 5-methylaminomethyl-2-thiouridine-forming methyltransferase MnmC